LGRKILVPTTVAAALRARHTLAAMAVAALLVLALALAAPVAAQEETPNRTQTVAKDKDASGDQYELVQGDEQQAEDGAQEDDERATGRATESLQGAEALIIDENSDGTVDRVEIEAAGCEVEEKGATVTVEDESNTPATFTNAPDTAATGADEVEATLEAIGDQVIVEVADGADLPPGFGSEAASEDGTVSSFAGITCGREDDGGNAAGGDENQGDNTKNNDDLEDLSCEELLVLFRGESSSGEQYADAAFFADSEVRAQVEVCLEKEIVEGTAADEDLPDTGGPSLLALAVLGFVSAAAGLSVIRGGRR
jgi:hypothetical protein